MPCQPPAFDFTRKDYAALLFDLDGVVVQTARVHAAAWKQLFDEYLQARAFGDDWQPFDIDADYRQYVDGKPRYDGVQSFLASRGIDLPYGTPDDDPDAETICGLGNRKNGFFNKRLREDGVEVFDLAVAFLRLLRARGFKTAVVSSSKNCQPVVQAAGIEDLFDTRVDGVVSAELGLTGKPEPDIFLEAARRLEVPAARAVVLEDAISGVQAGRRGAFGLVVGLDRVGHAQDLQANGADVVVRTFAELAVEGDRPMWEHEIDALPSALASLDEVGRMLADKRPFVALDYDGTLTPIVERPELAVLSDEMRGVVTALADRCTVAVISGRDRKDVQNLVGIDTLFYAGSHGFDISGPEGQHIGSQQGEDFLPALDEAQASIESLLADIPGSQIERKRFSVAVHYRRVDPGRAPAVEEAVDRVLAEHDRLRKGTGKMVFEVQPDIDWHKGKALCWLMQALGLDGEEVVPFYLGDDVTDEDAFRVLQDGGVGILVRGNEAEKASRTSAARYALDDCAQVREYLARLTDMLQGD